MLICNINKKIIPGDYSIIDMVKRLYNTPGNASNVSLKIFFVVMLKRSYVANFHVSFANSCFLYCESNRMITCSEFLDSMRDNTVRVIYKHKINCSTCEFRYVCGFFDCEYKSFALMFWPQLFKGWITLSIG